MVTYATVIGQITIPESDIGIRGLLEAFPQTTGGALAIPGSRVTLGPSSARTDGAGDLPTGAAGLRIPMGTIPAPTDMFWRFVFTPENKRIPAWTVGIYQITAAGTVRLDELVEPDITLVSPELAASVAANAAAAAASQAAAAASEAAVHGWADAASSSAADAAADADAAAVSEANAASSASSASTSAGTASTKASQAASSQSAAATSETNAATSATAAQTARTGAETARTGAETARTGAETARAGAEAVGNTNDTIMKGVDANPASQFRVQQDARLNASIAAQAGRTTLGTYIPPGWGATWYPKLAAAQAGTGIARLAIAGHSIIRGYYASRLGKGTSGLLAAALQAIADGGSGFQTVGDSSAVMVARGLTTTQANLYDTPGTGDFMATTGTWAQALNTSGPAGVQIYPTTAGATLAVKGRGTKARVTAVTGTTGGTYAVAIDGVSKGTFTTYAATAGVAVFEFTGLTDAAHQIVLTYMGAPSRAAYIAGVAFERSAGVIVDQYAIGGAKAADLAPSAVGIWTGGPSAQADLVILSEEANDLSSSVTADAWIRNVHLYLDALRGTTGGGTGAVDIIVVLSNPGLFDTSGYAAEYALRLRALCEHYGAALVNFAALARNSYDYWTGLGYWGRGASNPGLAAPPTNADKGHPSDAGHAFMANTLLPILTNVATSTVPSGGLPAGGNTAGTPAASAAPGQVTGLNVGPADGQLAASWTEPEANGAAITDYTVQYAPTGTGTWTTFTHTASGATGRTITGLTNGTTYDVRVAAVNSAGTGPWSATKVGTPAPATLYGDNFDRADSGTVGVTSTGGLAWTQVNDPDNTVPVTWSIVGNKLRANIAASTSPGSESNLLVDTGAANGTVQGTLVTPGTSGASDPGFTFRAVDGDNFWMLWANKTGGYKLMKKIAGGFTQVGATSSVSAANDVIKVILNGSSIKVYVNDVLKYDVTDTQFQTATKHGFRAAHATTTLAAQTEYDNWSFSTATS